MGFMRWFTMGDLGQQFDLHEQKLEIQELKGRMETETRAGLDGAVVQQLVVENKELKLYIATIFRALLNKKVVSHDELRAIIETIDAEDGKRDGRHDGDVALSADI